MKEARARTVLKKGHRDGAIIAKLTLETNSANMHAANAKYRLLSYVWPPFCAGGEAEVKIGTVASSCSIVRPEDRQALALVREAPQVVGFSASLFLFPPSRTGTPTLR